MSDAATTVQTLKDQIRAFCEARDWLRFHTPKNLGLALASEVGELLDHLRYRTDDEVTQNLADPIQKSQIADEIADCLWVLMRLAEVSDIDVSEALTKKLASSAQNYPIDQAFGRADKYTTYPKIDEASS